MTKGGQSITAQIAKGGLWIGAARAAASALSTISLLVLARLLLPADFGLVALATTILALVTALTEVSMNEAVVRHPSPTGSHLSTAWTLNALRGLLIFVALAAAGIPIAAFYGEPRLAPVMVALGAGALIAGLVSPRRAMLQRDLVFWQEFVLRVSQQLVAVVVSVVVALIFRSYWALVAGVVAGQIAATILSYAIMPFLPRPTLKDARELLSFSLWLTAAQIVNTLNWRFDYLLVGKYVGPSALGFYTVGSNLAMLPTRELTAPLVQTVLPGFAKIAGEKHRLAAAYQRAQTFVAAIVLPAGIGVALVAEPIILLLIGAAWASAIFVVQALAAIIAIQTIGSLVQPLAMALGETRLLFIRSLQVFAMRIPIVAAGLYVDGLRGVIIARVITGLIGLAVDLLLVRRFTGLSITTQIAANGRAILAVGVMAVGIAIIGRLPWPDGTWGLTLQVAVTTLSGAALYIGTTLASWSMMGRPTGPETQLLDLLPSRLRRAPLPLGRDAIEATGRRGG